MKRFVGIALILFVVAALCAQTNPSLSQVLATDRTYNEPISFPLYREYNPHRISLFVSPVYARMLSTPTPSGVNYKGLSLINVAYGMEYAFFFSRVFGLSVGVTSGYDNQVSYNFGSTYMQDRKVSLNNESYHLRQKATDLVENYSVRHLNIPLTLRFMARPSRVFAIEIYAGAEYNLNIGENISASGMLERRLYKDEAQTLVVPDGGAIQAHQGLYGGNAVFVNRPQEKVFADGFSALAGLNFHFRVSRLISLFFGGEAHLGFTNIKKTGTDWLTSSGYGGLLASNAVQGVTPFYYGGRVGFSFLMGRNRAATRWQGVKEAYDEARLHRKSFVNDSLNLDDQGKEVDRRVAQTIDLYERESSFRNKERNLYLTAILATQKDSMARAIREEIAAQMLKQKDTVYIYPPAPKEPILNRYRVVVASTTDQQEAEKIKMQMEKDGYEVVIDVAVKRYRVIPFSSESEAKAISKLLNIKRRYAPRFDDIWLLNGGKK